MEFCRDARWFVLSSRFVGPMVVEVPKCDHVPHGRLNLAGSTLAPLAQGVAWTVGAK